MRVRYLTPQSQGKYLFQKKKKELDTTLGLIFQTTIQDIIKFSNEI